MVDNQIIKVNKIKIYIYRGNIKKEVPSKRNYIKYKGFVGFHKKSNASTAEVLIT